MQRRYVIDADVVYDKVAEFAWARDAAWKRSINKIVMRPVFRKSYRYCLEHSSLALLQGQDVYDAYHSLCGNAHKVYHMPVSKEDYISEAHLQKKLDDPDAKRPLNLCYVGRAIEMKGPLDWIRTLCEIIRGGTLVNATWLGEGPLLSDMRKMAQNLGIAEYVKFPGYVSDRQVILRTLRDSDFFLFCHLAPESPRCLVEALASGCPLLGYGSAYSRDLVAQCGGGQFTTVGNWRELARLVRGFDKDRDRMRRTRQIGQYLGSIIRQGRYNAAAN